MHETVFACHLDELPPGTVRRVGRGEEPAIAVYNIDGELYATADRCTHATASLSDGELDGDCIACPVHWGLFHVPTGKALCFPVSEDLVTFPVEVVGREVHIRVGVRSEVAS